MRPEIKHVRIDGRLVHGQVITKWVFITKVNRIIVVDNEIINNPIEKNALKLSTPSNIKLSILGVDSAVTNINEGKYADQEVMILVKSPDMLRLMVEKGLEIDRINVGNISQRDNTVQVRPSVFLLKSDADNLQFLIDKGIDVYAQMIPADPEEKMQPLLSKVQ